MFQVAEIHCLYLSDLDPVNTLLDHAMLQCRCSEPLPCPVPEVVCALNAVKLVDANSYKATVFNPLSRMIALFCKLPQRQYVSHRAHKMILQSSSSLHLNRQDRRHFLTILL